MERDGQEFTWDDYRGELPGEWPGCGCWAEPIVDYDEEP